MGLRIFRGKIREMTTFSKPFAITIAREPPTPEDGYTWEPMTTGVLDMEVIGWRYRAVRKLGEGDGAFRARLRPALNEPLRLIFKPEYASEFSPHYK